MKKFGWLGVGLAIIFPAIAAAQAPAASTGLGFPIGEKSRIHTNLDLGIGFDTNPSRVDNVEATGVSDWRAVIRPGIAVDVPGESLSLGLNADVSIIQYLGIGPNLDRTEEHLTKVGANLGLKLRIGSKDGPVSFSLDDQLIRTPAFLDQAGAIATDEIRFTEWNNRGTARLTIRPGGRALEIDLGYLNDMAIYDANTLPQSQRHGGLLEARWKFFPKTAFVFHGDISTFTPSSEVGDATLNGLPITLTLGVVGQITTRLTAELTAGYGDTLTEDSTFGSRGPIGNAVVTYAFNPDTAFTIGYRRRIEPVVVLNSYSSDAPFAQFKLGLGGRLGFTLFGQYEFRSYAPVEDMGVNRNPGTQLAIGDARVEYWFFEFLGASLNYRLLLQTRNADADTLAQSAQANPTQANPAPFIQEFTRHQVMLMLAFRY